MMDSDEITDPFQNDSDLYFKKMLLISPLMNALIL